MKHLTLIPAPAMLVLLGFLIIAGRHGMSLPRLGCVLLMLLPLLALAELACAIHDFRSAAITTPRLALRVLAHGAGVPLAGIILFSAGTLIMMGPINPG